MSEKSDDILKELRSKGESSLGGMVLVNANAYADRIEAVVKTLEADRDNWRRQALDEDVRANATHKDSLEVGNAAARFKALQEIHLICWRAGGALGYDVACGIIKAKSRAALAKPPRNCDMMSLDDARKVWFTKEILPRLDGKLPLGKEKPFDEWFVSQHEEGEQK